MRDPNTKHDVGADLCVRPNNPPTAGDGSFPKRRQLRLKDYDYSQNNAYFVTICTKDRKIYFEESAVKLMIKDVWNELQNKFDAVRIDEFIVMPNHIHGILIIDAVAERIHRSAPTLGRVVQWFNDYDELLY